MLSLWFPTAGSVVPRGDFFAILLLPLLLCTTFTSTEAHDALDPTGNITIKWDVISWTPDGYIAVVTTYNFQQYRHIQAPGWILGWTWAKKEDPTVVDLLPGTPYNQQIANCCSGGVLTSWAQDPQNAISSFQLSVGLAGTTNETVKLPKKFTLKAPGPVTWNVTCTYSQFLAQKTPTCLNCPTCTCGCQNKTEPGSCVDPNSPHLASVVSPPGKATNTPLVRCTNHTCPI
ncbi:Protein COBRA [Glycine max]|nr:Protein COBRA [Glycine max]